MRRNEEETVRTELEWKPTGNDLAGGLQRDGQKYWKKILRKQEYERGGQQFKLGRVEADRDGGEIS